MHINVRRRKRCEGNYGIVKAKVNELVLNELDRSEIQDPKSIVIFFRSYLEKLTCN